MKKNSYSWSFILAIAIHVLLASIIIFSLSKTLKPAALPSAPPKSVIDAVAIDASAIQKEKAKLETKQKQLAAAKKRKQEKERLAFEKKKKEEEEKLAKIKTEKKRLEEETRLAQEQQKKLEKERQENLKLAQEELLKIQQAKAEALKVQQIAEKKQKAEEERRQKLALEQERKQKQLEEEKRKQEAASKAEEAEELARKKAEELAQKQAEEVREAKAAKRLAEQESEMFSEFLKQGVFNHSALIQAKIMQKWRQPVGMELSGLKCMLSLKLSPYGDVLEAIVVQSSGNVEFDRSTELAVMKASPLPMPADPKLAKEFLKFKLTFIPPEAT